MLPTSLVYGPLRKIAMTSCELCYQFICIPFSGRVTPRFSPQLHPALRRDVGGRVLVGGVGDDVADAGVLEERVGRRSFHGRRRHLCVKQPLPNFGNSDLVSRLKLNRFKSRLLEYMSTMESTRYKKLIF